MKIGYKPELYKKTVDILFQAYFNDTLMHQSCSACAVGNILLSSGVPKCLGETVDYNDYNNNAAWKVLFVTASNGYQRVSLEAFSTENGKKALRAIEKSGYTWVELALVEKAFENAKGEKNERMFNGLVAVLEALKEIHQVTDDEETLPRFQKHYATLK